MEPPTNERIRKARREIAQETGSSEELIRQLQEWQEKHPERMLRSHDLDAETGKENKENRQDANL